MVMIERELLLNFLNCKNCNFLAFAGHFVVIFLFICITDACHVVTESGDGRQSSFSVVSIAVNFIFLNFGF